MTLATRQDAALAPTRAVLLRRAAEHAEQVVAQADQAARALVARARQDAETAVAQARSQGAAQAGPLAVAERSRSRRESHSVALAAELRIRDELAARIRSEVCGLRDGPGYGDLRDRLADLARQVAGRGAEITEHPEGGVTARTAGVVVDCSLPRLADRVIEALGPQIARLCS
jgi:vacuolar-type H+-ATPase subunit E/Vma4